MTKQFPDNFDSLIKDAAANAAAMSGWDFSYINQRRQSDNPPWDYIHNVCSMLDGVNDMLDMDTGGGEVLKRINEQTAKWPARITATEGYKPNVKIVTENLDPIGVKVVDCKADGRLPFSDASFDLITNRHGAYHSSELFRILKPGGCFVTQQIQFADKVHISRLFGKTDTDSQKTSFEEIVADFQDTGFEIVSRQDFHGSDIFYDIGALVFVLTAAPWELPDFSIERYRNTLNDLHNTIKSTGPLDLGIGYLLLVARKPYQDR